MKSCDSKSCASCTDKSKQSREQLIHCNLLRIKHKLLVMSGKGGVGKSSVATYLALTLAKQGYQVGLLDVDLHGPSIPKMLGLRGVLNVGPENQIIPQEYSSNLKVVSIESMLDDTDSAVIWRGPLKHGVIQQFLADCKWDDLDFLIIDSPPGTGDEPLSVARLIPDAEAIIVSTPQEVALADVRKSINFCRKVKLSIVGLVENMSGLHCPHCQGFISIFRTGGGKKTAERMKLPFLGALPFDPAVVEGGDSGRPVLEEDNDSPFKQALSEIAQSILRNLKISETIVGPDAETVH
jgi:ATP-binding protein involved in chromosome partitioning